MTATHLFNPDGLVAFTRYLAPDTMFAFDLDGTLAPVVAENSAAQVAAPLRTTLERLVKLAKACIITGHEKMPCVFSALNLICSSAIMVPNGLLLKITESGSSLDVALGGETGCITCYFMNRVSKSSSRGNRSHSITAKPAINREHWHKLRLLSKASNRPPGELMENL